MLLDSDPGLFDEQQTVEGSSGAASRSVRLAPTESATLRVPLAARDGVCAGAVHRLPHEGAARRRHPRARRPLPRLRVRAREDRLRRLAALAPADRRRQLHPRLARRARRGGGGAARARRLRAHEPRRPRLDRARARRARRRAQARPAPLLPALARRLEQARPALAGARRRPVRRLPLLRLDVPAASGRGARDDDPRPRAAALSRVDDDEDAGDAQRQVRRHRADVRPRLRQLRLHGRATSSSGSASRPSGFASRGPA